MDCTKTLIVIGQILLIVFLSCIYLGDRPFYERYLKDPSKVPTSCEDFKYGCCEIFPTCHFNGGDRENLHVESSEINFKVAVKYNEQGTNCPRIKHIVTLFNSLHYDSAYELLNYNNGCLEKNSLYQCCSIDYMCDERYYEDFISHPSLHEGDYQTIYDEFYNGTEVLVLNKNDHPSVHFECPKIDDIVNVYQREMLKRNEKSIVLPVLITINHIILAITLCIVFNCIHCRNCRKREHQQLQQGSV